MRYYASRVAASFAVARGHAARPTRQVRGRAAAIPTPAHGIAAASARSEPRAQPAMGMAAIRPVLVCTMRFSAACRHRRLRALVVSREVRHALCLASRSLSAVLGGRSPPAVASPGAARQRLPVPDPCTWPSKPGHDL